MRRAVVGAAVVLIVALNVPFAWGKSSIVVRPGHLFHVRYDGFYPHALVTLRLANSARTVTRHADAKGVLDTRYEAPRTPGRYRLLISGRPAQDTYHPHGSARSTPTHDVQTIFVVVPRFAILPISVRDPGGHGVGPGSGHHGPPSATGFDVETPLLLGSALVLAGVVGLVAGLVGRQRGGGAE